MEPTDTTSRTDIPKTMTPDAITALNLRAARLMYGFTQQQVCELLKPFGLTWSVPRYSMAESSAWGRPRRFSASEIMAFALAFNVPPSWFFRVPKDVPTVSLPKMAAGVPTEVVRNLNATTHDDAVAGILLRQREPSLAQLAGQYQRGRREETTPKTTVRKPAGRKPRQASTRKQTTTRKKKEVTDDQT